MTKYCSDEKLREWVFGHNEDGSVRPDCHGDFGKCRYVIRFGKQEYCGYCPEHVATHQVIRSQAGCLWCRYATKKLTYSMCVECLSQSERVNFDDERNGGSSV